MNPPPLLSPGLFPLLKSILLLSQSQQPQQPILNSDISTQNSDKSTNEKTSNAIQFPDKVEKKEIQMENPIKKEIIDAAKSNFSQMNGSELHQETLHLAQILVQQGQLPPIILQQPVPQMLPTVVLAVAQFYRTETRKKEKQKKKKGKTKGSPADQLIQHLFGIDYDHEDQNFDLEF